jgi:hypothetical protein
MQYITSMYDDEVHILARRDVGGLNELAGKKVGLDLPGSGAHLTGSILFDRLGIPVEVVSADQERALALLERGEIAAGRDGLGQAGRRWTASCGASRRASSTSSACPRSRSSWRPTGPRG